MTYQHQALLDLPSALRAHGLTVIELEGWKENEQGYYWTNANGRHFGYQGQPNGWAWHHTATASYTPFVKNFKGQTKANIFAGLWRGDDNYRLHSEGAGEPALVMCSAGPANYSNGSGVKEVLNRYVAEDLRFHGPQRQSDDDPKWYGNRYYGGTEIVHRGDGSPLDQGVFRTVYIAMAVMMDYFEWSPWRHIGHLDHSRRKIDPRFEQGSPYTMGFMQDVAQGYQSGIVLPPTAPIGDDMEWSDFVADETWAVAYELDFIQGDPKLMPQYYFAAGPATEDEKKNAYNTIMQNQMKRTPAKK